MPYSFTSCAPIERQRSVPGGAEEPDVAAVAELGPANRRVGRVVGRIVVERRDAGVRLAVVVADRIPRSCRSAETSDTRNQRPVVRQPPGCGDLHGVVVVDRRSKLTSRRRSSWMTGVSGARVRQQVVRGRRARHVRAETAAMRVRLNVFEHAADIAVHVAARRRQVWVSVYSAPGHPLVVVAQLRVADRCRPRSPPSSVKCVVVATPSARWSSPCRPGRAGQVRVEVVRGDERVGRERARGQVVRHAGEDSARSSRTPCSCRGRSGPTTTPTRGAQLFLSEKSVQQRAGQRLLLVAQPRSYRQRAADPPFVLHEERGVALLSSARAAVRLARLTW